jgi:hypothetical protein
VVVALAVWLSLVLLTAGRRVFILSAILLTAALVMTSVIVFLPVRLGGDESGFSARASADAVKQVTSRTSNITTGISSGGGFSGRIAIWNRSANR